MSQDMEYADIPILDPEQSQFARSNSNLIALSSPPGSGKTEALTGRFSKFLMMGFDPHDILVLTFTNRARESFENRLLGYSPQLKPYICPPQERPFTDLTDPSQLWIGTFHYVCIRILKCHLAAAGFSNPPRVVDSDMRWERLHGATLNFGFLHPDPEERSKQLYEYSRILETMLTLGLDPTVAPPKEHITDDNWVLKRWSPNHSAVFKFYLDNLKRDSLIDVSDIPSQTKRLFDEHMAIRTAWSIRFRHVLVDEYQDTTPLQTSLLLTLGRNASIAACGDPDQSIFGFAGAAGSFAALNALKAKKGEVENHCLAQDYRLTKEIQQAANQLRQKMTNPGSAPPHPSPRTGEPPVHIVVKTPDDIPRRMASDIRDIINNSHGESNYNDFLVTARSNRSCVEIGQRLQQEQIPVWVQANAINGSLQKSLRNWLAFAAHPTDPWILVQTLCNPPSNVSRQSLDPMRIHASVHNIALLNALEENPGSMTSFKKEDFQKIITPYIKVRNIANLMESKQISPQTYIQRVLELSGLNDEAAKLDAPRKRAFLDYAEQLKVVSRFALNRDEISNLASGMNKAGQNPIPEHLEVRNMHQVKGLQWKYVLATDWVAGKFPMKDTPKAREEDRKLALTAITRASRRFISYSSETSLQGRIERVSAFIHEAGIPVQKIS